MPLDFNEIVNRLRENDPTVTDVPLIFNNIGDQEAQVLAQALTINTSLRDIDIGNKIIDNNIFRFIIHLTEINTLSREYPEEYHKKLQRQRVYRVM